MWAATCTTGGPRTLGRGRGWQTSPGEVAAARASLFPGAERTLKADGPYRAAFLARSLTGALLSWESLGSPTCAPLALVCPLLVLLELLVAVLAMVLAPRSVLAEEPGWELKLLALLLTTAVAEGPRTGEEG